MNLKTCLRPDYFTDDLRIIAIRAKRTNCIKIFLFLPASIIKTLLGNFVLLYRYFCAFKVEKKNIEKEIHMRFILLLVLKKVLTNYLHC